MPDYFALYSAATPAKLNKVRTLKDDGSLGKNVNINQRDNTDIFGNKHRYLTLGDAWHVTKTLKNNSEEFFNDEIANCLGRPLDNEFLCLWEEVNNIRNSGSHIRPLRYNEYEAVLKNVLSPTTIEVLTTIKEQLRDVRN